MRKKSKPKKVAYATKNKIKPIYLIIATIGVMLFIISPMILDMLVSRYSTFGMITRSIPALCLPKNQNYNGQEHVGGAQSSIATIKIGSPNAQQRKNAEVKFELMEIEEGVNDEVRIELMATKSQSINLKGDKPKILIYSTHATEAYTPTEKMPYIKTDPWRTLDETKNVTFVAQTLAKELSEKYNLSVIHDTTNYEPPVLGTSYTRSIVGMESYLEKYPSIDLFIDIHRDAYEVKPGQERDYALVNGEKVARLMFVVGTGQGKTGVGFAKKPNYKQNYAMALAIQEKLQEVDPKLARPIRIKDGRYNQHIPGRSVLIEVGHNENTLEEALASIPYLAKAISQVAQE